ncbi:MAG TPA: hypothetical protein VD866_28670 [Urbifossiella sp.]|nr:hypothetical protein [Urbifossiella sp.]
MPTLTIPDDVHRELAARAAEQNTTADELAARILAADVLPMSASDRLFDAEYYAECAADTSPVPTLEEIRAITSKIPGSMAADIIADREDRV